MPDPAASSILQHAQRVLDTEAAALAKLRRLLLDDDFCKFVVVDDAITVDVHLPDDLLDVVQRHRLAHINHDAAHLLRRDEAVARGVEDGEGRL